MSQPNFNISIKKPFVTYLVQPSAGGAGIQAAINAASAAGGGIVQLLPGTYTISTTITWPLTSNNVHLRGAGKSTILSSTLTGGDNLMDIIATTSGLSSTAINNPSIDATTITATTAGQAAAYTIHMPILITGNDSEGFTRMFLGEVGTAGNGSTGVIGLKYPLPFTLTSAIVKGWQDGIGNELSDFSVVFASGSGGPINLKYAMDCKIRNVFFNGKGYSIESALRLEDVQRTLIENCEIKNYKVNSGDVGLDLVGYLCELTLRNTKFQNCTYTNTDPTIKAACFLESFKFSECTIDGSGGYGFWMHTSSGIANSIFEKCIFSDSYVSGALIARAKSVTILGCIFYHNGSGSSDYGLSIGTAAKNIIISSCNFDKNTAGGVTISGTATDFVIVGNSLTNMNAGLVMQSLLRAVISGNNIRICATGIYLDAASKNINFTGNIVIAGYYGFRILDSNEDIVICGNTAKDNDGTSLSVNDSTSHVLITGNNFRGGSISLGAGTDINYVGNLE